MKQTIIEQKTNITDGSLVAGGGVYVFLSDSLPIVIGILTVVLLMVRIALAIKELLKKD